MVAAQVARRCLVRRAACLERRRAASANVQWDPQPQAGSPAPLQTPEPEPSPKASARSAAFDAAAATVVGLLFVGALGVAYHQFYKWDQLRQIAKAFAGGYDPILELEKSSRRLHHQGSEPEDGHVERPEQPLINSIVDGKVSGHYWCILGSKGSGKSSMFIEGMVANEAEGCAWVEAHEHPEVFRLRLGKALLYEFHEDYIGMLFQRNEPRDGGPMLDIERLLNKLEKVALRYRQKHGRPAVLIFNNCHYIHNDEEGHALLHMLQQRAEAWAASGCLTMCFLSDDYWPFAVLKKNASRMSVLTVRDLDEADSVSLVAPRRQQAYGETKEEASRVAKEVYQIVGGRLAFLTALARRQDMVQAAKDMVAHEKSWLLSRVPLIVDHDDVMDQQKFASSAFLLFQALAQKAEEMVEAGGDLRDVAIPFHEACQIMTRTDFLPEYDHTNLISIDMNHMVRADSILLLNVMRELVKEPDFQERLDNVRARIDEIESLHRTAELTVKSEQFGKLALKYW